MSALDTVTGSFEGGDWIGELFGPATESNTNYDAFLSSIDPYLTTSDIYESTQDAFRLSEINDRNNSYAPVADNSQIYTNNAQDEANFFAGSQKSNPAEAKGLWDKTTDFLGDKKNDNLIRLGEQGIGGLISSYGKSRQEDKDAKKLQELREYNDKVQKEKEDRADARAAASRSGSSSAALEMLAAKDAIDQANKARISASVSGLRPASGLINSRKKLTYIGGKPVFTDAGQLAQ